MINRCGYISFCDTKSNNNSVATVIVYYGNNISEVDEKTQSVYKYHIITEKIISYEENELSGISYLNLIDIINKALSIDKLNAHIMKYTFSFDINEKVHIHKHSIIKQCFPLPNKNLIYFKDHYYYNFTGKIFADGITSILGASLACEHLNNISVKNGFIDDRMFEHSYGRIFLNLNMFADSIEGREVLKYIIDDYDSIMNIAKVKLNRLTLKRHRTKKEQDVSDNRCNNFALQYHIASARCLKDNSLIETLKNTKYFKGFIDYEINSIIHNFESGYLNLYPLIKLSDIYYLSFTDILKLLSDSEFSYNIMKHISDTRKIYNGNKLRKIDCLKSDGSIYCIE